MEFSVLLGLAICFGVQLTTGRSLSGLKDQAFAVVGSRSDAPLRKARSLPSTMTRMKVTSVVRSRYAKVTTLSEMQNTDDGDKEMTFSVRLPEAAFITEFTMLVDGITFVGKVKEKAQAKAEFEGAKNKGNAAGLVSADVRQTQTFNVAANVPAHSSVTFTLVYQELLKRRLGKYDHSIFVNPGQLVDDFVVNVFITEKSGITMLAAKHPQGGMGARGKVSSGYDLNGEVEIDTDIRRSKYQAKVSFKPTQIQQRRLLMIPEDDRKVSVMYDVTRETLGGEIQTRDGYFVHYFAPANLPVLPKKVVFVIDRSGSMSGRKMEQTKAAFETVLRDMGESDEFNIVDFAGDVTVWKPDQMVKVTTENVNSAIAYVKAIRASGSTNLNGGLMEGANLLADVKMTDKVSSAMITLTDGDPTHGVTNTDQIRLNVKRAVEGKFSVFCIGFGEYLNHDFLKLLAKENDGITRKIYEDADADLQLAGFFQEVATPLLLNIKITYAGSNVTDVSETHVDKYFGGSEVIIVGAKVKQDAALESKITALSKDGEITYSVVSEEIDESFRHWHEDAGDFSDFIERIWAYFTIKGLLEDRVLTESREERGKVEDRIMNLALKYNFVTPLTSMIVVLPEDEITTTPGPSSTIHPPFPPCFMRGEPVPDDFIGPPIMCPYIVDDALLQQQQRQNSYYRTSSSYLAMAPPASASLSRIVSGGVRGGPAPMYMYGYPGPEMADYGNYETPPPIERAENCSGLLNGAEGRITAPTPGFTAPVYCEWDVQLEEGWMWIDLLVKTVNTSESQVKITSDGETLLDHFSGVSPSKFFFIDHHSLRIVMTIYPDDKPDIEILYSKFTPLLPAESSSEPEVIESLQNCGHNISSSEALSGTFDSPNYPSEYPSNANCVWKIVNKDVASQKLKLRIADMDIEMNELGECVHDKLILDDGVQTPTLCGFDNEIFMSTEEVVTVSFISDDKLEVSGFHATYEFVSLES